jgi:hypothetical protein
MYSDPANIRSHVVKLRLNDNEAALLDALVNYTGEQKATLFRELLLEQAQLVLCGNSAPASRAVEVPQLASFGT